MTVPRTDSRSGGKTHILRARKPPGDDRYDQILALKGRDALPGVAVFDRYYRPRHQWRGPCIVTNNRLRHTVKNSVDFFLTQRSQTESFYTYPLRGLQQVVIQRGQRQCFAEREFEERGIVGREIETGPTAKLARQAFSIDHILRRLAPRPTVPGHERRRGEHPGRGRPGWSA